MTTTIEISRSVNRQPIPRLLALYNVFLFSKLNPPFSVPSHHHHHHNQLYRQTDGFMLIQSLTHALVTRHDARYFFFILLLYTSGVAQSVKEEEEDEEEKDVRTNNDTASCAYIHTYTVTRDSHLLLNESPTNNTKKVQFPTSVLL